MQTHDRPCRYAMLISALELSEEARVVFGEQPEVVDPILEVCDALHAHAERIARVNVGIYATCGEVVRVHHSASENLYPSSVLAEVAALASADGTRDVHLRAWLGEWEERRAQTNLRVRAEHLASEREQHLLEVGEAHALVHVEPFHLMEEAVGTSRDGLVAIDTPRAEHADRRLMALHVVSLVARGVGAQKHVFRHVVGVLRYEERVLHVARRMVCGEVEHCEDVLVVVDLRPMKQREAHALENLYDLVLDDGERMARAQVDGVGRAREVEALLSRLRGLHRLAELVDLLRGQLLELVDLHAELLFLVFRHGAELVHELTDLTFLAQVFYPEPFHVFRVLGGKLRNLLQKVVYLV